MAKLPKFDADAVMLLSQAEADSDAAAKVLLLAAQYMRRGETLPEDVAQHLAGAFEAAMAKDAKHRGRELLRELHLAARNRRPAKANWLEVGGRFQELMSQGNSQGASSAQTAVEFKISEATAKRRWKKYVSAMADYRALNSDDEPDQAEV